MHRAHLPVDVPEQCCGVCLSTLTRRGSTDGQPRTTNTLQAGVFRTRPRLLPARSHRRPPARAYGVSTVERGASPWMRHKNDRRKGRKAIAAIRRAGFVKDFNRRAGPVSAAGRGRKVAESAGKFLQELCARNCPLFPVSPTGCSPPEIDCRKYRKYRKFTLRCGAVGVSLQNGSIRRLRVVRAGGGSRVARVLIRMSRVSAGSITSS